MGLNDRKFSSLVENNKTAAENALNIPYAQVGAGLYTSSAPTLANGDYGFLRVDSDGKLLTTASISGDVNVDNTSLSTDGLVGKASGTNADFTTAYASATTLTCSTLPTGVASIEADDVVSIQQVATAGSVTETYTRDDITLTSAGTDPTTLTVAGAAFVNTDTFIVTTSIARALDGSGYSASSNADRVEEVDPLDQHYVGDSLVDTTNISAATHYYPSATGMSIDSYKDLSVSGKFIDADGTLTLTIEMMNDEDTTSGDWIQVYAYDDKNNTTTNSWTVTNGTLTFANSFNEANYKHARVKVVASGATNTVIVKARRKAL